MNFLFSTNLLRRNMQNNTALIAKKKRKVKEMKLKIDSMIDSMSIKLTDKNLVY